MPKLLGAGKQVSGSQIIFQRDGSIVVTPGHNLQAVAAIVRQAYELRKVVAGTYVYRLSPIAIWGSAARGIKTGQLIEALDLYSATGVPATVAGRISELIGRYGVLRLVACDNGYRLESTDPQLLRTIDFGIDLAASGWIVPPRQAGRIKLAAARAGWPVVEPARERAARLDVELQQSVSLRPYQQDAVDALKRAGSGVVLLPCGAGKTIVGIAAMCHASGPTLVLGPSRSVAEQWRDTIVEATSLSPEDVSIAGPGVPIAPVTVATYHGASFGQVAGELLDRQWSLVIYDEVQSLPADVFRLSAALSAPRKVGLSATLVREDGRQREVFALIGPPVYDIAWTELEAQGWIAPARCIEVRIPAAPDDSTRARYKQAVVDRLLTRHAGDQTLVVGSRVATLRDVCSRFGIPYLTGSSSARVRADLLDAFRREEVSTLGLSRIGSVGIDLPGAEVLVQISGTFGSRQEEAQRLGRLLRPGDGKLAHFYTLVSEDTPEVRYAEKRQRFLVEQGYRYEMVRAADLPRSRQSPNSGSTSSAG